MEQAATADGRRAGNYLSANYAPSLHTRTKGPVSLIHSFTKPDLIVRVWGWSGYFVELDKVYQDHIIQREEILA